MSIENAVYKFFADYIFKFSGIHYPEQNYYQLEARLKSIADSQGFPDVKSLCTACLTKIDPTLHNLIIDVATNNETSFFRDIHPFDSLKDIIRKKISSNPNMNLNIWSAACSAGQEPYSIAMTIKESYPHLVSKTKILATDLSKTILAKAKAGIYSQLEVQRGLAIQKLVANFNKGERNSWVVKDELRNMIEFSEFNLINSHYPTNHYDVVFCRNVLIYQPIENKQKILEKVYSSLKDEGVLILGNAESTVGIKTNFVPDKVNKTMVLVRPNPNQKSQTATAS